MARGQIDHLGLGASSIFHRVPFVGGMQIQLILLGSGFWLGWFAHWESFMTAVDMSMHHVVKVKMSLQIAWP